MVGAVTVAFALAWAERAHSPPTAAPTAGSVMGLAEGAPRGARLLPGTFWGVVTGFASFVSHAGAAPYQIYVMPQKLSKTVYAGTTTITFAYVNAIKLVPYWALGQFTAGNLKAAAVLTVPAGLAVYGGVVLVRVMPQALFFRCVTWALALVSAKLIWDAAV